jgi:uridine kinase
LIEAAIEEIVAARRRVPTSRSVLAAVSGIDGSGKGFVSAEIVRALEANGYRVAGINIDGWLNLPHVRFAEKDPAEHFYRHAIRFDELFSELLIPLRDRRRIRVESDFAEETATSYRKQAWAFDDVDVVVVEGIYLLKRELRAHHDVSFWIDCSFETALERAIARAQEGLPVDETVRAYRTIYFPAQEIHFTRDEPRAAATRVITNDPRLGA